MTQKCKVCSRYFKTRKGAAIHHTKMHGKRQVQEVNVDNSQIMKQILKRIRLLELSNNFLKCQLKHKTFNNSKAEAIERIKMDESRPERNENKNQFGNVVKEMKKIFTEDFDYHDVLKSINPIEIPIPINLPIMVEVQ